MDSTTQNDFAVKYEQPLINQQHIIVTQTHFKKDSDIKHQLNKKFGEEKLFHINYNIKNTMSEIINQRLYYMDQEKYNQRKLKEIKQEEIQQIGDFWSKKLEKSEKLAIPSLKEKIIKVCCRRDYFEQLKQFHLQIISNDRNFYQHFKDKFDEECQQHALVVTKASTDHKRESDIAQLVSLQMQHVHEIQREFNNQFIQNEQIFQGELHSLVEELWLKLLTSPVNIYGGNANFELFQDSNIYNSQNEKLLDLIKSNSAPAQMSSNNNSNSKMGEKNERYSINLCLGGQRQYNFQICIKQSSISQLLSNERCYSQKIKYSSSQLDNFIYGTKQVAFMNIVEKRKDFNPGDDSNSSGQQRNPQDMNITFSMQEFFKYQTDLYFENFETQIHKHFTDGFDENSIAITSHTNLGIVRYLCSILYSTGDDYSKEGAMGFIKEILLMLNQMHVRHFIIPINYLFRQLFEVAKSQSECELFFQKLCLQVQQSLLQISQDFTMNQFLTQVTLFLDSGTTIKFSKLFEKLQTILISVLE